MKLDAILWDYDGTLVNSVPKNIDITKHILSIVAPHLTGDNLPECLQSEVAYHQVNHAAKNWQDLYVRYYGMTESEMLVAGSLWSEHQLSNTTPVQLFSDVDSTIKDLASIPHGICSQNASNNIVNVLNTAQVDSYFKAVIGYDDVSSTGQKPSPESGLLCLNQLFDNPESKTIMYIGDHEADVQFARNIHTALGENARVIAVAVTYSGATPERWATQPDFIIHTPTELTTLCEQYSL
ncbi:HAD family hydrolase [Photobacterium sanguinicancri]|uniref:phosphoglycolate phosphatase n=1 Tax=Photobacterium sanguinicancri TaxID=875932 RepID=A0ABX4G696_9GAMM|nr:HAD family hydrolase [Photobacterium sanguinicancri]OZS43717.1 phosphatase [Photobacterium sanguinicancri]OZS45920.1 phosphatase [Photobacterium sanguinicancri]